MNIIKKTLKLVVPQKIQSQYYSIRKQLKNFKILSSSYGQLISIKKGLSIDHENMPLPWYTYPTIEFFSHLDLRDLGVLEWGSGNSSLWWLSRCKASFLVSIENDLAWYKTVSERTQDFDNFSYLFFENSEDYVKIPESDKNIDVVIIDGKFRNKCFDSLVAEQKILKKLSILILDNSDWYPELITRIRVELEWIEMDFHGFGPINNYTWTTSIFVNPSQNKLKYKSDLRPIGGLDQVAG